MAAGEGHGSMVIGMRVIQMITFAFNLIFVIIGAVFLGVGIYLVKDPKLQVLRPLLNPEIGTQTTKNLSNVETLGIGIIIFGSILLIIGFLGCCGAVKGFRFLHVIYAIIIGAIIIAEIAVCIVFFTYYSRFKKEISADLQNSIANDYIGTAINNNTHNNPLSLAWDFAQFNLNCCGALGPNDYSQTKKWDHKDPYHPEKNLTVPLTCCPMKGTGSWDKLPNDMTDADECATTGQGAYAEGCYNKLIDILAKYKRGIIIAGIIVGLVEILAFIFSITLYCRKDDDYNKI